jgi:hypothetical protein
MAEKITTKNFVVNCNWNEELEVWFVRHPQINKGEPEIIGKGHLEGYLSGLRDKLVAKGRCADGKRGQNKRKG